MHGTLSGKCYNALWQVDSKLGCPFTLAQPPRSGSIASAGIMKHAVIRHGYATSWNPRGMQCASRLPPSFPRTLALLQYTRPCSSSLQRWLRCVHDLHAECAALHPAHSSYAESVREQTCNVSAHPRNNGANKPFWRRNVATRPHPWDCTDLARQTSAGLRCSLRQLRRQGMRTMAWGVTPRDQSGPGHPPSSKVSLMIRTRSFCNL